MNPLATRLLVAFCALPGIVFGLSLLLEHRAWLWDATVYRCAVEATLATGSPYRFVGDCAGYFLPHTYPFAGTWLLAQLARLTGEPPLQLVYLTLYAGGVMLLSRSLLKQGMSPTIQLLFLVLPGAGVLVSELVSGNIGVPFYGLLFWLIWRTQGGRSATPPIAAAIAVFKPLYLAYALAPPLLRHRRGPSLLACGFAALWYAGDALAFPEQFRAWLAAAFGHANEVPGFGFSMLVRKVGIGLGQSPATLAAYALWAGLVLILTLRATARVNTPAARAFTAIAGIALLLPRLKEYDCLILLPLSAALWQELTHRERREWMLLVGGFSCALPALLWWLRKLPLLWNPPVELWRAFVDMRWLVQNQGAFLFAALLAALFWLAVRRPAEGTATGSADTAPVVPS